MTDTPLIQYPHQLSEAACIKDANFQYNVEDEVADAESIPAGRDGRMDRVDMPLVIQECMKDYEYRDTLVGGLPDD